MFRRLAALFALLVLAAAASWVCRFRDGMIDEITEYMDSHLAVTTLALPA